MARATAPPSRVPKALLAWFVLGVILVFIMINWPSAERAAIQPISQESTQTTSETTETTTSAPAELDKVEVVADTLNFRSSPKYEDRTILKTLVKGTTMVVKERDEGWLFVELDTGQSGYVADKPDFIRKVDQE